MGDLFDVLWDRVEPNAQRALASYTADISEYRPLAADEQTWQTVLDFGIYIRRRTVELAATDSPLTDDDLAAVTSIGRRRAEQRLSLLSQQQALGLHTDLMLREIQQAAGPGDTSDLFRMLEWFGAQGLRARAAYLEGYGSAASRSGSLGEQRAQLARMLLADHPVQPEFTARLGLHLAPAYLVCVIRFSPTPDSDRRTAVTEATPARPALWTGPGEYVVLHPTDNARTESESVLTQAVDHLREIVPIADTRCSVGGAVGAVGALGRAVSTARSISEVAPRTRAPQTVWTVAELFIELCIAPGAWVDDWLGEFIERLRTGPHLVATLDGYYRNNMNRATTAAQLRIHPRTLDYRLQRVRDLTGEDPASTRGVRILTTAVNRCLAADGPGLRRAT